MGTSIDIQRLITDGGYRPCPSCPAVLRPTTTRCPHCRTTLPVPSADASPQKKTSRPRLAAVSEAALGSLQNLPERRLTFTVIGTPVTQGSVEVPAPGVVKYSRELREWRRQINAAARKACGTDWEPANCPLVMSAVFTLPRPKSAPKTKAVHAATKPDIDKLIRAVQDALSPADKKAFRVYTEDSRIVGYDIGPHKTYPTPLGTHDWALPEPGVTIAVAPAPSAALRQDIA
ncbi:RusA family crossover junction endodeoxyribonuclease [Streptomyces sp. NPDC001691]|uniref:RusA family crossover junction endodeoxyribonuclease n=1 Tax=Streptomyces sp. NPDC001691 TaxID=3364600 RepID=UPI0036926028